MVPNCRKGVVPDWCKPWYPIAASAWYSIGRKLTNANKWIHVLLVVLQQTLRDLGDAPARHLQALEGRLVDLRASQTDTPPLFFTTGVNDPLPAPKIAMSKKRVIAARKSGIR